jgi:hypothetical protein
MQSQDPAPRPHSGWPPSATPTQHPPVWGPPQPAPRPHRRRRTLGILTVVLAALVALVGTVGLVATRAANRERAANSALFKEGGCVKPAEVQDRFLPATCSDPAAEGKVIAVVAGSFGSLSVAPCPDDTDVAGTSAYLQAVCVRNLRGRHPGDAGQGGGVLRAGDCIVDVDAYAAAPDPEVACSDSEATYRVLARVAKTGRCPAGTRKVLAIQASSRPKVCASPHRS